MPDPRQYEGLAEAYETHAARSPHNALYDRPAVLALLGDVRGRRVLDAGCGPGFYLEALLARGAEVLGCDASPRMIALAKKRVGERARLWVQALEEPFAYVEDGSLDLVLSALVHHYLDDRVAFLKEARRMLKPGGALVLSTLHPMRVWHQQGGPYFVSAPFVERWRSGWKLRAWRVPLGQLTEEFAAAGFLIERLVEPKPHPRMQTLAPEVYARLMAEPRFILFRLLKPAAR